MKLAEKFKMGLSLVVLGVISLAALMILSPEDPKPKYDDMGLKRDVCMSLTVNGVTAALHIEEANEKKLYVVAYVLGQEGGFLRTERAETVKLIESGDLEIKSCAELGVVIR